MTQEKQKGRPMKKSRTVITLFLSSLLLLSFQNCDDVQFKSTSNKASLVGDLDTNQPPQQEVPDEITPDDCLSNPNKCDTTKPYVNKPGVVTILLALGDQFDNELVIQNESSQLIAEDMVKYASPVKNPKILLVRDHKHYGESSYDFEFIANTLLKNYEVDMLEEPSSGLSLSLVDGYDLIWFNNPGHPMSNIHTRDTLIEFKGGVVLSGDDLTRGDGFKLDALTGLKHINNGTTNICDGESYSFDNNYGEQYEVSLSSELFPGVNANLLSFQYGNDIDDSEISPHEDREIEVLAAATAQFGKCTTQRPVVIRYSK